MRNVLRPYRVFIALIGVCLPLMLTACYESDLGSTCGTAASATPTAPIDGEDANQDVVRLEGDVQCQSLQCLRQQGSAYCTQRCARHAPSSTALVCVRDSDCMSETMQCHEGRCVTDDCPDNYWCKELQPIGLFADTPLCLQRVDCHSASRCTLKASTTCDALGCAIDCFATCPLTP